MDAEFPAQDMKPSRKSHLDQQSDSYSHRQAMHRTALANLAVETGGDAAYLHQQFLLCRDASNMLTYRTKLFDHMCRVYGEAQARQKIGDADKILKQE